jgi:hypothetical protein
MMMTMMIQIKIFMNQNGRISFHKNSKKKYIYIIFYSFSSDDITEWDQNFIKQFTVQEGTLFDIIMVNLLLIYLK